MADPTWAIKNWPGSNIFEIQIQMLSSNLLWVKSMVGSGPIFTWTKNASWNKKCIFVKQVPQKISENSHDKNVWQIQFRQIQKPKYPCSIYINCTIFPHNCGKRFFYQYPLVFPICLALQDKKTVLYIAYLRTNWSKRKLI